MKNTRFNIKNLHLEGFSPFNWYAKDTSLNPVCLHLRKSPLLIQVGAFESDKP